MITRNRHAIVEIQRRNCHYVWRIHDKFDPEVTLKFGTARTWHAANKDGRQAQKQFSRYPGIVRQVEASLRRFAREHFMPDTREFNPKFNP